MGKFKPYLIHIGVAIVVLYLCYSASQTVIGGFTGIGNLIPPRMVNQQGYETHLKGTLQTINDFNLQELKRPENYKEHLNKPLEQRVTELEKQSWWMWQRHLEEVEFQLRYIHVMQDILKWLSKFNQVESA